MGNQESKKNWYDIYLKENALWVRNEKNKDPHVEASSEFHSDGFFNYKLVNKNHKLMEEISYDIIETLSENGGVLKSITAVVGMRDDDDVLTKCLNSQLGNIFSSVLSVSKKGYERTIFLSDEEMFVLKRSKVLLCTNVIAKGENLKAVSCLMRDEKVDLLPVVVTLMNRSGYKEIAGLKIISPLIYPLEAWDSYSCPLCIAGNKVISGKKSWNSLISTH